MGANVRVQYAILANVIIVSEQYHHSQGKNGKVLEKSFRY